MNDELRQTFMNNLNFYLNLNNFSQADLARYMHVSTATAAKWCTGQTMPRVDKIQSLCNWFQIEKSDLLEDHEHKNDKPAAPTRDITDHEYELILAYRKAPDYQKMAICDMLHVKGDDAESSSSRKGA